MMKRSALAATAFAVLLATGCGGDVAETADDSRSQTALTDEQREQVYVTFLRKEGIVPTYGEAEEALVLGRQICDRYRNGDNFVEVVKTLTDNGFTGYDAGQLNGAATAAFCPEHKTP